ncbi:MAG: carboxypeptidase regulatory-like domain-containing protein [Thermoplasmata archaeon]|nr:carboxypeptidase regulatory-like domain-containing protein [Thermoplasmata archaeon]
MEVRGWKVFCVTILLLISITIPDVDGNTHHENVSHSSNIEMPCIWEEFLERMRNATFHGAVPLQNSLLCGYVRDNETGQPIENAIVHVFHGDILTNLTTDKEGFYSIYLEAGRIYVYCNAMGYYFEKVGEFEIKEYETLWVNISMRKAPPQNSTVCGYIRDNETGQPIENARVDVLWEDDKNNTIWNISTSDKNGFYEIRVPPGKINVGANAEGYLYEMSDIYSIKDGERLWVNLSLPPAPPEDAVVCGYLKNVEGGEGVEGVEVHLWWDDGKHSKHKSTESDKNGFYSLNTAEGHISLYFSKDGYFSEFEYYDIKAGETIWLNISLYPLPPINAGVRGYVVDNSTGSPVRNATVVATWRDDAGHSLSNSTHTDDNGFYTMPVPSGEIILSFYAARYFPNYGNILIIGEGEDIWFNASLISYPEENAVICGYVRDAASKEAIKNATIYLRWSDGKDGDYTNVTSTNEEGFYSINVAQGEIYMSFYADGYFEERTEWFYVYEHQTIWLNMSLYPIPVENSVVCGYVYDEDTGKPLKNADVVVDWRGEAGNSMWNATNTDESGFYTMNVAAGRVKLHFYSSGHFSRSTEYINISENEKLWQNVSLTPRPEENTVVCGYINDEVSGEPLKDVEVYLRWEDDEGHEEWNYTYSNESGFYSINVAKGRIYLSFYSYGYFRKYLPDLSVEENETVWLNISLYPFPVENSVVCGYVYDESTGEPISHASVYLYWEGEKGYEIWNSTVTNEDGFYSIKTAAGKIYLHFFGDCYEWNSTDEYKIGENETLWISVALKKADVDVIIKKPYRGIYIFNRKILPSLITVVIGKIDVEMDVYGPVWEDYTEYVVDGVVRYVDPFNNHTWTWDERIFFRHELKVVVHTITGKILEKSIKVWIFNL